MLKQNMTKDGMNVSFSSGSGLSAKAMNNLTAMKMKSDAYKSELAKKGETGEVDYPNTYPLTTTRNVTIALKGDANKMMHGVAGDAEVTAANMAFSLVDNVMRPIGATASIVEGVGAVIKSVASIPYLLVFCFCFAFCLTFAFGFQHGEMEPFAKQFFIWASNQLK